MRFKKWFVMLVVVSLALAAALALLPAGTPLQAQGGNLLVGGDFEATGTWPQQDGIGEVQVAPGWRAYYLDAPPPYVQVPNNCPSARRYDCYWMRPEFRDNTSFPNRIHSGARSQKYFSFGRMHEAGLMQRVEGIKPGATLQFSIWMQAWMCSNPDNCGKLGEHSDAPANMHLRVGIDPTGGTNAFAPSVIWSGEQEAFDRWVQFSVRAQAQGEAVTVFTHSRAEWDWARQDNDVYLDDGSLVYVEGAKPTTAPRPTLNPTLAAQLTLTPRATATATLTTTRSLSATVVSTATLAPTVRAPTATPSSGLCLSAFLDASGNGARDPADKPAPDVTVVVLTASSRDRLAWFTTDSSEETRCLRTLPSGDYIVQATAPQGFLASTPETRVSLVNGQRTDVAIAVRPAPASTATPAPTTVLVSAPLATPVPAVQATGQGSQLAWPLIIIGVLAVAGVTIVLVQRRMARPNKQ